MRHLLLLICLSLAAGFTGSIVWASAESDVLAGFGALLDYRWGWVATIDLYLGFLFVIAWIGAIERPRWTVPIWALGLLLLGNLVTLIYLAMRLWRSPDVRTALLGGGER
ncbi:MAG: hypothetical protein RLY93_17230 [Sumerlaeia bacterium]